MKKILIVGFNLIFIWVNAQQTKMKPLFNGKNLDGWYSFLVTKGKNNDPEKVFTVEIGLLHISKKEFGYICNEKIFKDFTWKLNLNGEKKNFLPGTSTLLKQIMGFVFMFNSMKKIPYGQNLSNARYRKEMSVIYG